MRSQGKQTWTNVMSNAPVRTSNGHGWTQLGPVQGPMGPIWRPHGPQRRPNGPQRNFLQKFLHIKSLCIKFLCIKLFQIKLKSINFQNFMRINLCIKFLCIKFLCAEISAQKLCIEVHGSADGAQAGAICVPGAPGPDSVRVHAGPLLVPTDPFDTTFANFCFP